MSSSESESDFKYIYIYIHEDRIVQNVHYKKFIMMGQQKLTLLNL